MSTVEKKWCDLCFGVSGYWADEWRPCPQCKGSGYQPR